MSNHNNKFDPEIWALSLLGDVLGFIDEVFLDLDAHNRDALKLYLDSGDLEDGLFLGVKERRLEGLWQAKIVQRGLSEEVH